MVHLLDPVHYWKCPSCGLQDQTQQSGPHTQMHACAALGNAWIPLLEVRSLDAQPDGRHVVVNKEDYVGGSDPVAAIRTERGDGSNDLTVFAEAATVDSAAT